MSKDKDIITCPKCKHSWTPEPTWKSYLSKSAAGNDIHHRLHFFSNKGTSEVPKVTRTRLYFKKGTPVEVIRAALELTAIDHKHDKYFRWCDTADGTIESYIKMISR